MFSGDADSPVLELAGGQAGAREIDELLISTADGKSEDGPGRGIGPIMALVVIADPTFLQRSLP